MSINCPNQFKFKNLQFSHNWILFDEWVSSENRGENTRGSMFRWNKNTGYNFLSIHSQFKSLSYGARVHCQTTTDIIPERQYDRHFKDSALQRTIQHLFNFRYLHDFAALCSSAIHFYTRIMLSPFLSFSLLFSLPLLARSRKMKHPLRRAISFVQFREITLCRQCIFDAWRIIKDAPLRFITFEIYSLFLSSPLVFFPKKENI